MNGRVENVCPSSEEETWVVNVKRAIVSALQNSQHDLNTDTETREVPSPVQHTFSFLSRVNELIERTVSCTKPKKGEKHHITSFRC